MARKKKETQRREKSLGSVFKSADGRWRAMINLGRDENGKRIRKQVYYGSVSYTHLTLPTTSRV